MVYVRIVLEPLRNNQSDEGQPQKGQGNFDRDMGSLISTWNVLDD